MKQFRHIWIILLLAGISGACNDWLNQTPFDKVPGEELYASEAGAQEALNGLYLGLMNRRLYGGELTVGLAEAMSGHYSIPDGHKYSSPFNGDKNTAESKAFYADIWKGMYKLIAECNVFLAQTEIYKEVYNPQYYQLYRGEALALRTFLHFDLYRLFGPAYTEENKSGKAIPYYDQETENPVAFVTAEELARLLMKDIDEAIGLLKEDPVFRCSGMMARGSSFWDFRNMRLNIYAAWALKARMCLHFGDRATANQIASALLKGHNPDGGNNNFLQVFPSVLNFPQNYRDPVFFSEIIFGMHDINRDELHKKYFSLDLKTEDILLAGEPRLSELFPQVDDIRYKIFIDASDKAASYGLKGLVKYQFKTVTSSDTIPYRYQTIPLIKKGEIFLIAAESSENDAEKALWLEVLRLNRNYNQQNVSGDLNELLQKEYEREFYGEGQYFYFLKRNGKTTIQLQDGKTDQQVDADFFIFPVPDEEYDNRTE